MYQIPVKEMCVKEAATPGLMNWKGDKGYPAFTSGVNVLGVPAMDLGGSWRKYGHPGASTHHIWTLSHKLAVSSQSEPHLNRPEREKNQKRREKRVVEELLIKSVWLIISKLSSSGE